MTAPLIHHDLDSLAATLTDLRKGTGQLYFHRTERKLVLTPDVANRLRDRVAERLSVEEWVPGRRRTRIHSIYFDTPDFALYRRSRAPESALHLKVRLRAYGDAGGAGPSEPERFLETKVSTVSPGGLRLKHKARLLLDDEATATVLRVPGAADGIEPTARRKFWRPLLATMATQAIHPRLTVSYIREAFVDPDANLRITFDEALGATAVGAGAVSPLGTPPGTLAGVRIVEIKFLDTLPPWLTTTLEGLGLPTDGQPFSKYKTAVPLLFPAEA